MSSSPRAIRHRRRAAREGRSDARLPWRLWFYACLGIGALAAPERAFGGAIQDLSWTGFAIAAGALGIGVVDYWWSWRNRMSVD